MSRQKPQYAGTTWQDLAEALPAWESEYRVRVVYQLVLDPRVPGGGFVEVVLQDGNVIGIGREVLRHRGPFKTSGAAGQAGQVMHATFLAFAELERNPWLWSPEKRLQAVPKP